MIDYSLPRGLYMQTIWFIKQYEEKWTEHETLAWSAPVIDGQPRGSGVGNPTEERALKAVRLSEDLKAIDDALKRLPEYYREPVLENTLHKTPWPDLANPKTYKRYKRMFVYYVAKNMHWL